MLSVGRCGVARLQMKVGHMDGMHCFIDSTSILVKIKSVSLYNCRTVYNNFKEDLLSWRLGMSEWKSVIEGNISIVLALFILVSVIQNIDSSIYALVIISWKPHHFCHLSEPVEIHLHQHQIQVWRSCRIVRHSYLWSFKFLILKSCTFHRWKSTFLLIKTYFEIPHSLT